MSDLAELTLRMRRFTEQRGWERFHDPKSLLLALVGEVGELSELLQWLPADEVAVRAREEPLRSRLGQELGDLLLYLVRLAEVLSVDLGSVALARLRHFGLSASDPGRPHGSP